MRLSGLAHHIVHASPVFSGTLHRHHHWLAAADADASNAKTRAPVERAVATLSLSCLGFASLKLSSHLCTFFDATVESSVTTALWLKRSGLYSSVFLVLGCSTLELPRVVQQFRRSSNQLLLDASGESSGQWEISHCAEPDSGER